MGIEKNISLIAIIGFFLLVVSFSNVSAQKEKRDVIQFSGVVSDQDTVSGIMGVHIYVPKGGRGTTTNYYGYFSFPVLEGDSVVISSVGFQKTSVIVPVI